MYRFLCSLAVITTLSLSYVSQQVKLLEYSYRINDNRKRLCLLIDENERLGYNVASLKSPVNIKQRLALNNIKLDAPENWRNIRLVKTEPEKEKIELTYDSSFKIAAKSLISILTPKAEAIAQELEQP